VLLFLWPLPGLTPIQGHLFAIFAATVISLVAQPVPAAVTAIVAITILA
jgi:hypothetical protein